MPKARSRADPVSCQLCRMKKLKCNRVQPCSNCMARGVTCVFLAPPNMSREQSSASTIIPQAESLGGTAALIRLERLEAVVLQPALAVPEDPLLHTAAVDEHSGERTRQQSRPHNDLGRIQRDGVWESLMLQSIGTREDTLLPELSDHLVLRITDIRNMLLPQSTFQPPPLNQEFAQLRDTVISFPTYQAATLLLQSYESYIDHMCPILHMPTIRSLLPPFYLSLASRDQDILWTTPLSLSLAALFLSMFAISAFFYQPFPTSEIAGTELEATHLATYFTKGALDLLDYLRRSTSGTLEDIQAYILMSLVISHLEGFSSRGRMLAANAVSLAKDLRLNRLDDNDQMDANKRNNDAKLLIEQEIKRRVFWMLASNDWLQSTVPGPQEGTYSIHLAHVDVLPPSDCAIEAAIYVHQTGLPIVDPHPTGVTYFLQKIKLAHICREITDAKPRASSTEQHSSITTLSRKLDEFLSDLPFFLRLDAESRQQSMVLETVYPMIPLWRYCITTYAHSQRCRLHQLYFLKQHRDSAHTVSRRACLESARAVLDNYDDLCTFYGGRGTTLVARMGIVVHFTHLALAVLVVDVCFTKGGEGHEEVRRDVTKAMRVFEDSRHELPLFERSLNAVRALLEKYNV